MYARRMRRERNHGFICFKILTSAVEIVCDFACLSHVYNINDYSHEWAHENKLPAMTCCTVLSLILSAFKIIMSFCEACGDDSEDYGFWSDTSLLLSLLLGDVPKSCVNLWVVSEHRKYVNRFHIFKAIYVILFKCPKRHAALDHHFHFRGSDECVKPAYVIGTIVEACIAILTGLVCMFTS
ncbi:unnamed protein product [Candidula unifasciata]|uniref:Uncharacterized protein n=1 Tax=Candidula unifasciata TaxID=100452 RepID=A0A8S3YBI9_9EUPU|nr:unnamed protein product [Candidula unifasciata]